MEFLKDWPARSLAGELPAVEELIAVLEATGSELDFLYKIADEVREKYTGAEVHVRGIIEFSNICQKNCNYCGIRSGNNSLQRYMMTRGEILRAARQAKEFGYGTVVLQSGEQAADPRWLCELIEELKNDTEIAVTLSVGICPPEVYHDFKKAGCDRYLLRFETANEEIFKQLHPDENFKNRIKGLKEIEKAGLQTGSGFMIGLPESTLEDIARDIIFTSELNLDMIGCGPFISSPATPLKNLDCLLVDREIYFKTIALLRLLNPRAHIPATTAYDALFRDGRNRLLKQGANVFMPNITPPQYRSSYQLYPDKPCVDEHASQCAGCVKSRLASLNRPLAKGPGHSMKKISDRVNS
ncbi:MAG: [FeFe] hydrogenase H-cluster radical SAM maturase HydE [bacterium]